MKSSKEDDTCAGPCTYRDKRESADPEKLPSETIIQEDTLFGEDEIWRYVMHLDHLLGHPTPEPVTAVESWSIRTDHKVRYPNTSLSLSLSWEGEAEIVVHCRALLMWQE